MPALGVLIAGLESRVDLIAGKAGEAAFNNLVEVVGQAAHMLRDPEPMVDPATSAALDLSAAMTLIDELTDINIEANIYTRGPSPPERAPPGGPVAGLPAQAELANRLFAIEGRLKAARESKARS